MKVFLQFIVSLIFAISVFGQTSKKGDLSLSDMVNVQKMEISKAKDTLKSKGFIFVNKSPYEEGNKFSFANNYNESKNTASRWATFYITPNEYAFYYKILDKEGEPIYTKIVNRIKAAGKKIEEYNGNDGSRVSKYSYMGKTFSFGNNLTKEGNAEYFIEVKD